MTPAPAAPWRDRIRALRPSVELVAWLASLPPETTYTDAWGACPRGDWLLWLVANCEPVRSSAAWSPARRPLVAAAVACARLALPTFEARVPKDDRPRRCIDTTAAWCRGEATRKGVERARRGAWAAAVYADAADAAADAADADAYAASAYAASAYAAAYAAYAADAAAEAAADAASDAASASASASAFAADAAADATTYDGGAAYAAERARVLRECADIVRAHFPAAPELP